MTERIKNLVPYRAVADVIIEQGRVLQSVYVDSPLREARQYCTQIQQLVQMQAQKSCEFQQHEFELNKPHMLAEQLKLGCFSLFIGACLMHLLWLKPDSIVNLCLKTFVVGMLLVFALLQCAQAKWRLYLSSSGRWLNFWSWVQAKS